MEQLIKATLKRQQTPSDIVSNSGQKTSFPPEPKRKLVKYILWRNKSFITNLHAVPVLSEREKIAWKLRP